MLARIPGLALLVLGGLCAAAQTVTVTPNTDYLLLANTLSTISLTGTGFGVYMGSPSLSYKLAIVADDSKTFVSGLLNATSDTLVSTDVFLVPSVNGTVHVRVFNDSAAIDLAPTVVATIVLRAGDVGPPGCVFDDEDPVLLQPIKTGETLVGQYVAANSWAFYQWQTLNEPVYAGATYTFTVDFSGVAAQPLGVFVKYTDVLNIQPALVGYDPQGNPCPVVQCSLLSASVPIHPSNTCGFDARLLSCDNVKFENQTAGIIPNRNCVLASDPILPFTFTITSVLTRSGQYVIGIQGQGATPTVDRTALGYCGSCEGFQFPRDLLFSISVKTGNSGSSSKPAAPTVLLLAAAVASLLVVAL